MFKVLICGSRDYSDEKKIERVISYLPKGTVVIHGAAKGADSIAGKIAEEVGLKVESYPADWKKYSKAAGPIRNRKMVVEGKPDLVIAFYSNKKESKGTKNMVFQANKEGIPVVEYEGNKKTSLDDLIETVGQSLRDKK